MRSLLRQAILVVVVSAFVACDRSEQPIESQGNPEVALPQAGSPVAMAAPAPLPKEPITSGEEIIEKLRGKCVAMQTFEYEGRTYVKELFCFPRFGGPPVCDEDLKLLAAHKPLVMLHVQDAPITDRGLAYLKDKRGLGSLMLKGTKITDEGVAQLAGLVNLGLLDVSETGVTDAGVRHLRNMTGLVTLCLAHTGVTDACVEHLLKMRRLKTLDLAHTGITDAGLAKLAALPGISSLDLRYSKVTDEGLKHLNAFSGMEFLYLDESHLTPIGAAHLAECRDIPRLNLEETKINDACLRELKIVEQLTSLCLRDTRVTGAGLKHLRDMPRLTYLYIDGAPLTDKGIEALGAMPQMELLSIQDEHFADADLERLTALTNLRSLSLDFTGVTKQGIEKAEEAMPQCRISTTPDLRAEVVPIGEGDPDVERVSPGAPPAPPMEIHVGPPVSEDEARAVAGALVEAARAADKEAFYAQFDWDAMALKATAGIKFKYEPKERFLEKWDEYARGAVDQFTLLGRLTPGSGHYGLVRVYRKDRAMRALMRTVLAEGQFGYLDLVLARRDDGEVRIVDVEVPGISELLTQTWRRLTVAPFAAYDRDGRIAREDPMSTLRLAVKCALGELYGAVAEGDNERALRAYARLPAAWRREKYVLMFRLRAAREVGDDQYLAAVEEYRRLFPGEVGADLLSIGYHLTACEFDEALQCVERIDRTVGPDPFLDVIRGMIHVEAGDLGKARKAAERAVRSLPDVKEGYLLLLGVSLEEGKHAETLDLLRTLGVTFGYDLGDISQYPAFAEFVKSPEYGDWLRTRGER